MQLYAYMLLSNKMFSLKTTASVNNPLNWLDCVIFFLKCYFHACLDFSMCSGHFMIYVD